MREAPFDKIRSAALIRIWIGSQYSYTPEPATEGGSAMWDTVQVSDTHLSHDLPCLRCGHALHTFLACGDDCPCEPVVMPGSAGLAAA